MLKFVSASECAGKTVDAVCHTDRVVIRFTDGTYTCFRPDNPTCLIENEPPQPWNYANVLDGLMTAEECEAAWERSKP